MQDHTTTLAAVEREIEEQNATWHEISDRLLKLGDVELSLEQSLLSEIESASHIQYVGSIPAGLLRM